jgi:peptide/nickel transport system permease protein
LTRYIINKFLQALIVLLIITFLSYLIMEIIPGDVVGYLLGLDANPEKAEQLRAELNLDKPFLQRYIAWLFNLFKGNLGTSIFYHESVTNLLSKRLLITFRMGFAALILSTVVGIAAGIISAVNRGGFWDNLVSLFANIGISIPSFWLGILMILFFAMKLGILPVQGYTDPSTDFLLHVKQMVMPVILTAVGAMSSMVRQTRSAVLETISQDYVRTARAKGFKERMILIKHVLRNALIPILTLLGMQIRVLFGGVVIVENIYGIPGMGSLLVNSVFNRDVTVVQGCILVMGIVVVIANFIVDISYGVVDPRIREAKGVTG